MTVKEFWHLKYGTIVEKVVYDDKVAWRGKVIKREVVNEIVGGVLTKSETLYITTSRKILQITFDTGKGSRRYADSDRPYMLENLRVSQEETLLPNGNFI